VDGIISAIYAEVAVGLNPVEKPWTKRRRKNPATLLRIGYKKPQMTQTVDPMAITGTRPHLSVNLPLNGLEIPAVSVKRAMIRPLWAAPPKEDRKLGNSGMIMLKLAENRSELKQSSPNCIVYKG